MTFAIIAAGGKGKRFQGGLSKQLLPLMGKPILTWTLKPFQAEKSIDEVILVYPYDEPESDYQSILEQEHFTKVRLVKGGLERYHSVLNGYQSIQGAKNEDVVLIHDAARPLLSAALLKSVLEAAIGKGTAIPVLAVWETVKEVDQGKILKTWPRERLCLAQTPQAFQYGILCAAYEALSGSVLPTDEAMMVEKAGFPVFVIPGEKQNVKITEPEDIALAEYYLHKGWK